jgi:hypothetical protein
MQKARTFAPTELLHLADSILVKMERRFDLDTDSNRFPIPRRWLKTPILERTHCLGRKPIIIAFNKCCRAYAALLVDYGVKLHRSLLVGFARFIGVRRLWTVDAFRLAYARGFL